ncbi:hypothetical protein CLAFUW4_11393 [Fulvia fulva]|uniref:Uncharacterized protein n=1 Tax=Passalora fulva TaxID=5499 RepID=A0A9Q8URN6_PASFU|nr:uncharacterized protein CLAFUR5_10436 [Fulvia fulva]KAK4619718.1 hypothetical protein CLAFUR4_11399 [Fulvia fulva]KAK4620623.1 hypothetical protein CLAFUR0_11405 [Fulvia fulva]UJO19915.1 hypothetical protein CLAFUR5_10436 [Fulvia fulva]WPV17720.1 hypothetical protein CLAFUW4_11393 [Fulvia fulva]WPV32079.1 hypothetical protein CLAFUW7_11389 [Fulvia fulva]
MYESNSSSSKASSTASQDCVQAIEQTTSHGASAVSGIPPSPEHVVGDLSLANVLAQGPVEPTDLPARADQQQALVKIEYQGPRCDDGTRNWVDYYP